MKQKRDPYDNALMESFYGTIKRELIQDTVMGLLNKLKMIFLNILNYITIPSRFIQLSDI